MANIADYLTNHARKSPDQIAVYEPCGKVKNRQTYIPYTYREFEESVNTVAAGLQKIGIAEGSRTALLVRPSFDFFVLTFALLRNKCVPVFVDPGLGVKNLKRCLGEAELDAFIALPAAHIARVMLGWGRGRKLRTVWVGRKLWPSGTTLSQLYELGKATHYSPPRTEDQDLAAIVYTSGSTGAPKGVLYSHKNFHCQVEIQRDAFGVASGEVDLCTFPLFALFAPGLGMTSVIPKMDFTKPGSVCSKNIIEPIQQFGVTHMFGSPALLAKVVMDQQDTALSLPTLRRVVTAGAPSQPRTLRTFSSYLCGDSQILTPYGATECLPIAVAGSKEILAETASQTESGLGVCVGVPVAGLDVRIIKVSEREISNWSDEHPQKAGEIGEIVVRGPQASAAYLNRPQANQLAKISAGDLGFFHRMGDLGYFDDLGRLWFCGRKAHRVIGGSRTWYSVPVEGVFNQHPAVSRSALIPVRQGVEVEPGICIELLPGSWSKPKIKGELQELGSKYAVTKAIRFLYFKSRFPVDIRHNSKIFREKLAHWANMRQPDAVFETEVGMGKTRLGHSQPKVKI